MGSLDLLILLVKRHQFLVLSWVTSAAKQTCHLVYCAPPATSSGSASPLKGGARRTGEGPVGLVVRAALKLLLGVSAEMEGRVPHTEERA